MKELLEKIIREAPHSGVAGKPLVEVRKTPAKKAERKPEKKTPAEKKAGTLEVSGAKLPPGEIPDQAQNIQEKLKVALDRKGQPLTTSEKLTIIQHELPTAQDNPKIKVLKDQEAQLRATLKSSAPSSETRRQIEQIINTIPKEYFWDIEVGGVASEMQQAAFNEIMREPAYQLDMDMKARIAMGKTFRTVNADRVYEDERHLKRAWQTGKSKEITSASVQADRRLARELAKHAESASIYDVEGTFLTVPPTEPMDLDAALEKVKAGPEWIKKLAPEAAENPTVATFLAELADASLADGNALDDPAYLYMKAAKLSFLKTYTALTDPGDATQKNLEQIERVNKQIFKRINTLREENPSFKVEDHMIKRSFFLRDRMETGRSGTPGVGDEFEDSLLDWMRVDPDKADLLKKVEDFNARMLSDSLTESEKNRFIFEFVEGTRDTEGFYYDADVLKQMDTDVVFKDHMERLRIHAQAWEKVNGNEREVIRGWSSLYLGYEYLRKSWISPKALGRALIDESVMYQMGMPVPNSPLGRYLRGNTFAGGFSKAAEHLRQQAEGYWQSEEYKKHRINFLSNTKNHPLISRLSGEAVDPAHIENHKWYKEVTDPISYNYFKADLSKYINTAESLTYLQSAWKSVDDLGKLKESFSNFGDDGILLTLQNRPINKPMWDMYQRIAREEYKWHDGHPYAPDADTQVRIRLRLHEEAKLQMNNPESVLNRMWEGWEGSLGEKLTEVDIQNSAREVEMLAVVTGRRAGLVKLALTPKEAAGFNGSPGAFAGEGSDGNMLLALGPLRALIFRWGLNDPVMTDTLRHASWIESVRYGFDKYWEKRLAGVEPGSEEFKQIASWAFYITEPNNPKAVEEGLKWLSWNPDGSKRVGNQIITTLDAATKPGERQLTVAELREWIIFREGVELFDARLSGAYNFWEWGVALDPLVTALEARFSGEGIALHERAKMAVGGLLSAVDHDDFHKRMHDLINTDLHHGPKGVLVEMGELDPLSSLEALYAKGHAEAHGEFRRLLPKMNAVHDATGRPGAIVDGRMDLLTRRIRMPMEYIDREMALDRKGRVNYKYMSADQKVVVQKVCGELGVDADAYIDLMKEMSTFATDHTILEDLANPVYATHFNNLNYMDIRVSEADNDWAQKQWSPRGSQDTNASGTLLYRFAGDASNSKKAIVENLYGLLKTDNEEEALRLLRGFFTAAEFSGGQDTLILGVQTMGGGILRSAIMDWKWDLGGTDPETTLYETSNRTRAGGRGQMSWRRDKADHFWHKVESITNTDYHRITPMVAHAVDKVTGMKILGIPSIRIYNGVGFLTQATVLLALAAYENYRKGLSGGGSSGGGGAEHH